MIDSKTENYNLPKPNLANYQEEDVPRIAQAIDMIDHVLGSPASGDNRGLIRLATAAEAETGTEGTKAMTPATARAAIDTTPEGNPATIFANPTAADFGDRYVVFASNGNVTGKTPMYELYGTQGTQGYFVSTWSKSSTESVQEARLITTANGGAARYFSRMRNGGVWGRWRESPSFSYYPGKRTLIVDGENGDDAAAKGTEALPYKTIKAALDSIPYLFHDVDVLIKAGTYQYPGSVSDRIGHNLVIKTYSGARDVTIIGPTGSGMGALGFNRVGNTVVVQNLNIVCETPSSAYVGIIVVGAINTTVTNCRVVGFQSGNCVRMESCANANVSNCELGNANTGLSYYFCANAASTNNITLDGYTLAIGLMASTTVVRANNAQPTGTSANIQIYGKGQVL